MTGLFSILYLLKAGADVVEKERVNAILSDESNIGILEVCAAKSIFYGDTLIVRTWGSDMTINDMINECPWGTDIEIIENF